MKLEATESSVWSNNMFYLNLISIHKIHCLIKAMEASCKPPPSNHRLTLTLRCCQQQRPGSAEIRGDWVLGGGWCQLRQAWRGHCVGWPGSSSLLPLLPRRLCNAAEAGLLSSPLPHLHTEYRRQAPASARGHHHHHHPCSTLQTSPAQASPAVWCPAAPSLSTHQTC